MSRLRGTRVDDARCAMVGVDAEVGICPAMQFEAV
jgi:hypothetical protein